MHALAAQKDKVGVEGVSHAIAIDPVEPAGLHQTQYIFAGGALFAGQADALGQQVEAPGKEAQCPLVAKKILQVEVEMGALETLASGPVGTDIQAQVVGGEFHHRQVKAPAVETHQGGHGVRADPFPELLDHLLLAELGRIETDDFFHRIVPADPDDTGRHHLLESGRHKRRVPPAP